MRILHVFDHSVPTLSGYSLRSRSIVREQRKLKWTTFQLTGPRHGDAGADVEDVEDLTFFRTPPTALPRWLARAPFDFFHTILQTRRRLRAVIETTRPDVIHAHSPCSNGLAALGLGLPVVYEMRTLWEEGSVLAGRLTEGSPAHRFSRSLETFVLRRADAVVTISQGLRAEAERRGVPGGHVTVVPNAVDDEKLRPPRPRERVQSEFALSNEHVLGYIGSIFPWEGIDLLLRSLAQLREQGTDVGLLIVGTGPQEEALRQLADDLRLGQHVRFAGRIEHERVLDAYDAVDVLVYPRLPMHLTDIVTPLKPLEAMALRKPLIASDVGGHRELVRDGETGALFPAGDQEGLTRTIIEVIRSPELRKRYEENGVRFLESERLWKHVVPRYEAVYRRLAPHA